jgi:excisionase family DNA binding protein
LPNPDPTTTSCTDQSARTVGVERLLTAAEVADLLAVPISWVREATRDGRIPHLRLGHYRRYRATSIESWLESQQTGPESANRGR